MRRIGTWSTIATAILLGAGLSGCARMTSIHRVTTLPDEETTVIAVDAKQRTIIGSAYKSTTETTGHGDTRTVTATEGHRFCAEPPPDALTALATSLAAEGSVTRGADNDAALKLASSLSENASTIERSQTVNILREAMYRNCERYMSGAIDRDEFIVQAARDQQTIIQVLAIEQLTGAARAQATALTTVAYATGSGTTEATILALDAARKDAIAKRTAATQSLSEANARDPKDKSCDGAPHATPNGTAEADAAKLKAKNEACAAAALTADTAKGAEEHYATLSEAVARQSGISADASGSLNAVKLAANQISADIANAIVQITQQSHVLDEVVLACMVHVRKVLSKDDDEAGINAFCEATLNKMQDARARQLLSLAQTSSDHIAGLLDAVSEPPSLARLLRGRLQASDAQERKDLLKRIFALAGVKELAESSATNLLNAVTQEDSTTIESELYSLSVNDRRLLAEALSSREQLKGD